MGGIDRGTLGAIISLLGLIFKRGKVKEVLSALDSAFYAYDDVEPIAQKIHAAWDAKRELTLTAEELGNISLLLSSVKNAIDLARGMTK